MQNVEIICPEFYGTLPGLFTTRGKVSPKMSWISQRVLRSSPVNNPRRHFMAFQILRRAPANVVPVQDAFLEIDSVPHSIPKHFCDRLFVIWSEERIHIFRFLGHLYEVFQKPIFTASLENANDTINIVPWSETSKGRTTSNNSVNFGSWPS